MADAKRIIVVVDDDVDMNQAIQRLLTAAGFQTVTFATAESLLIDGAASKADCLILDVHLPGRSGFELHGELNRQGVQAPVIFITAFEDPKSRKDAEAAGAIAFLTKPFPGQTLLGAIEKAVQRP
jgi:FixJ family two-component response regulator